MHDADITKCNTLPHEVKINLNVLGALMVDGVAGHVDGADVCRSRSTKRAEEGHEAQGEAGAARWLRQHRLP